MSASEDIAQLRAALEDAFCNCTGNAIVSEKRQDHALAALARLEQRVDAGGPGEGVRQKVEAGDLRTLAENARTGPQKTWWLWDENPNPECGPILSFARAATPEAVIALCVRLAAAEALVSSLTRERDEYAMAASAEADHADELQAQVAVYRQALEQVATGSKCRCGEVTWEGGLTDA